MTGGTLLGPLFRSNVWKFLSVQVPVDLMYLHTWISGVFFWVLNFENLYFFGYWSEVLYFWGFSNKCCIFKCLTFSTVFF